VVRLFFCKELDQTQRRLLKCDYFESTNISALGVDFHLFVQYDQRLSLSWQKASRPASTSISRSVDHYLNVARSALSPPLFFFSFLKRNSTYIHEDRARATGHLKLDCSPRKSPLKVDHVPKEHTLLCDTQEMRVCRKLCSKVRLKVTSLRDLIVSHTVFILWLS
jgi:hypothetical protein